MNPLLSKYKGFIGRKILYILTTYISTKNGVVVDYCINVEWKDPHQEVKEYLTELLRETARGQFALRNNFSSFQILSSVLIPSFMNDHLTKNLTQKKFKFIVDNSLRVITKEIDIKTLENNKKIITGLTDAFDGTLIFKDLFMNESTQIQKTINDLTMSHLKLHDKSLRYQVLLDKAIEVMVKTSEYFEIQHNKIKEFKRQFSRVNKTIVEKMRQWIKLVRFKINRKEILKSRKIEIMNNAMLIEKRKKEIMDQKRLVVDSLERAHGNKNKKNQQSGVRRKHFIMTKFTNQRRKLILHEIRFNYDYITFRRLFVRCVDEKWMERQSKLIRLNRIRVLENITSEYRYQSLKKRIIDIPNHLKRLMTIDEMRELLIADNKSSDELLFNIKKRYLKQFY